MLDKSKQVHRPERLRGYDYSRPGYYLITLTTKVRGKNILCSIEGKREAETPVGPAPLGRPISQQQPGFQISQQQPDCQQIPLIRLTSAGEIVQKLIERIPVVYQDVYVDCYAIMPDHVHLLLWLGQKTVGKKGASGDGNWKSSLEGGDGPAWGPGPTALPRIVNSIKGLTTKKVGESIWQNHYYDHIIRNQEDLQHIRQYIQNNPLKWLLNQGHDAPAP